MTRTFFWQTFMSFTMKFSIKFGAESKFEIHALIFQLQYIFCLAQSSNKENVEQQPTLNLFTFPIELPVVTIVYKCMEIVCCDAKQSLFRIYDVCV